MNASNTPVATTEADWQAERERVRGLPEFIISIGVIDAGDKEALPALTARADSADCARFVANRAGRSRVVVHSAKIHKAVADDYAPTSLIKRRSDGHGVTPSGAKSAFLDDRELRGQRRHGVHGDPK